MGNRAGEDRLADPRPVHLRLEGNSSDPDAIWGRGPVLRAIRGSTWFAGELADITGEGRPLDAADVAPTWQEHVAHRHT